MTADTRAPGPHEPGAGKDGYRVSRPAGWAVALTALLVFVLALVPPAAHSGVRLVDVAPEAGIDFRYTFGDFYYDNILESSGSGVSVFDFDGDGYQDLYFLNGTYLEDISDPKGRVFAGAQNRLYRNRGDGTFEDVTHDAGLEDERWSMAAAPADLDGDGDVDIFLANYGPNAIYRNDGNGRFTDIIAETGMAGPETLHGHTTWTVSVAFLDDDGDGRLDVMVGNFLAFDPYHLSPGAPELMPHPDEYRGQTSFLYRQRPGGRFEEVTESAGLLRPDSKCMGLVSVDIDGDSDLDLYQANDHQTNFLFRSNGDGTFEEIAIRSGVAMNDDGNMTGSMHGNIGDVDGDGLLDVLVADLRHGSLYRNLGGNLFEDVSAVSGTRREFEGKGAWGAALFDVDNDGDLDIFSANGAAETLVPQLPLLLENDGAGKFSNAGPEMGSYFRMERSGRGAAVVDFDNDGDMDLAVSHVDLRATAVLLRNDGGNANHWLGIRLVGEKSSASELGAQVTLEAGDLRLVRVCQPATGYLSYSDPRLHFGLGSRTSVDRVNVRWVGGPAEVFESLPIDRYITLRQGEGRRVPPESP